jgi:hypothetical protein
VPNISYARPPPTALALQKGHISLLFAKLKDSVLLTFYSETEIFKEEEKTMRKKKSGKRAREAGRRHEAKLKLRE